MHVALVQKVQLRSGNCIINRVMLDFGDNDRIFLRFLARCRLFRRIHFHRFTRGFTFVYNLELRKLG